MLVHLDAAYNLARWLMKNEQDAADIVQEACLRALRGFGGFHGGDARAWLLTIVRNAAMTRLKARQSSDGSDEMLEVADEEAVDGARALMRADDVEQVRAAIEQLPADIRTVIILRELEGLSYKQIAGVADVPIGTVMSRISRGRQRLAELLARYAPTQEQP